MAVKKAKTQARPKNRINKQKEMEQRKIKRRRKKIVVTLFIAIVVGISAYFSMSPTFKIQTVTVNGNAQLSREKIMEIAGIKIGDNIFSKIGIVLKVKLKQNGAIEEAKVNKIYPNRIDIEITERSKRFQIQTESGIYIGIDEQGYVLEIASEKADVPVIIGMNIKEEDVDKTKRLEDKDLDKMENILQIYSECKKINIDDKITQIQVEDEYILKLENEGITIDLGNASNLKDRMYYVSAILKQEAENKGTINANGNLNEGFLPYFSAE